MQVAIKMMLIFFYYQQKAEKEYREDPSFWTQPLLYLPSSSKNCLTVFVCVSLSIICLSVCVRVRVFLPVTYVQ